MISFTSTFLDNIMNKPISRIRIPVNKLDLNPAHYQVIRIRTDQENWCSTFTRSLDSLRKDGESSRFLLGTGTASNDLTNI